MIKIKLNLEAGKATPNPPVGPVLGQYGLNINLFCIRYNKITEPFLGMKIPVSVMFSSDSKIFTLKIYPPSLSSLISMYSINKQITINIIKKIIVIKRKEIYPLSTKKCLSMVYGTLKSMNISIKY